MPGGDAAARAARGGARRDRGARARRAAGPRWSMSRARCGARASTGFRRARGSRPRSASRRPDAPGRPRRGQSRSKVEDGRQSWSRGGAGRRGGRRRRARAGGGAAAGPQHRDARAARHARRGRAGDCAEDPRLPRGARRLRLGRGAGAGDRDRREAAGGAARGAACEPTTASRSSAGGRAGRGRARLAAHPRHSSCSPSSPACSRRRWAGVVAPAALAAAALAGRAPLASPPRRRSLRGAVLADVRLDALTPARCRAWRGSGSEAGVTCASARAAAPTAAGRESPPALAAELGASRRPRGCAAPPRVPPGPPWAPCRARGPRRPLPPFEAYQRRRGADALLAVAAWHRRGPPRRRRRRPGRAPERAERALGPRRPAARGGVAARHGARGGRGLAAASARSSGVRPRAPRGRQRAERDASGARARRRGDRRRQLRARLPRRAVWSPVRATGRSGPFDPARRRDGRRGPGRRARGPAGVALVRRRVGGRGDARPQPARPGSPDGSSHSRRSPALRWRRGCASWRAAVPPQVADATAITVAATPGRRR